jgi:hypothetical protein
MADLEVKELRIDELLLKIEQDKEIVRSAKEQNEMDAATIKVLRKKISQAERKELEFIENCQTQTEEVEEAKYERDSCLKRETLLVKEIETLTKKCQDQSKTFRDKLDYEIQT